MYFSKGLCNEAGAFACNTVKVILLSDEMLGITLLLGMVPVQNRLYSNAGGDLEEIFAYYRINSF